MTRTSLFQYHGRKIVARTSLFRVTCVDELGSARWSPPPASPFRLWRAIFLTLYLWKFGWFALGLHFDVHGHVLKAQEVKLDAVIFCSALPRSSDGRAKVGQPTACHDSYCCVGVGHCLAEGISKTLNEVITIY